MERETNNVVEATPGAKEKAIFWLKTLIELIENDHVRADQLQGLTVDQVIDMAEIEAQKAVDKSKKDSEGGS